MTVDVICCIDININSSLYYRKWLPQGLAWRLLQCPVESEEIKTLKSKWRAERHVRLDVNIVGKLNWLDNYNSIIVTCVNITGVYIYICDHSVCMHPHCFTDRGSVGCSKLFHVLTPVFNGRSNPGSALHYYLGHLCVCVFNKCFFEFGVVLVQVFVLDKTFLPSSLQVIRNLKPFARSRDPRT